VQRLKSKSQFQAVLEAERITSTTHFVLHRCKLTTEPSASVDSFGARMDLFKVVEVWLGAMVPKRWAKRAVTRNAIKRQIYTVSLQYENALPLAAYVVRLRAGFDRTRFISATSKGFTMLVRAELQQLFAATATRPLATPANRSS